MLATELYNELIKEGFKVFFSRITLEDKLGTAYELYIFAALNSSKVMVVLGTKPEYFNAVWVKNEWSRFLALIKNGEKKTLIPSYRDMDPYDLPEEFSHLQAQDMSKLGFMQDLVRGINKIIATDKYTANRDLNVLESVGNVGSDSLIKRCYIFLEDQDWTRADEYIERVLDLEPYNHKAYFLKALVDLKCKSVDELKNKPIDLHQNRNFERAFKFSEGDDKAFYESIIEFNKKIIKQKEIIDGDSIINEILLKIDSISNNSPKTN